MQDIKSAFELYKELKEKHALIPKALLNPDARAELVHSRSDTKKKEREAVPVEPRSIKPGANKPVGYAGERLELIEKMYEKARYQKLYGIEAESEEILTQECLADLKQFIQAYPHVICKIKITDLLQDDRGNPYPAKYSAFFEDLQRILRLRATTKLIENSAYKLTALVIIKAREMHSLFEVFEGCDLVQVSLPNYSDPSDPTSPSTLIIHTANPNLSQRIQSEIYQIIAAQSKKVNVDPQVDAGKKEFVHTYAKQVHYPEMVRPSAEDVDFILSNAPRLFPWLHHRYATLQKIVFNKKTKRDELRFYRNSYKNGKHKIMFDNLNILEEQIALGAFAFIADSACTNTQELPCGPYSICIDFDPSDTKISYDELLDYVFDFHSYFVNEIGFDPKTITWLHSGNNSFHVRIAIPEFDANQYGLLLPKTHSFDTYYRRKKDEMNITFLHDAVELLILKYNLDYTRLDRVSQRIAAFSDRSQFKLFADNRTQLHGGARVPLSWHTKSHRYCRVFDVNTIPDNSVEVKYLCSRDYLSRHPQWLDMQNYDCSKNADILFSATSDYLTKNFNKLTYQLQVWNGKMDPMAD